MHKYEIEKEFQPALPARGATSAGNGSRRTIPFQPALPARGATIVTHLLSFLCTISTRAPREGSDPHRPPPPNIAKIFQPALPARGERRRTVTFRGKSGIFQPAAPREGSDICMKYEAWRLTNFNPRSPRGERRSPEEVVCLALRISTRAPREGSDLVKPAGRVDHPHFNPPLPREGSDAASRIFTGRSTISTRAPREGSDSKYLQVLKSRTQQYRQTLHRITTKTALFPFQKRHFPL